MTNELELDMSWDPKRVWAPQGLQVCPHWGNYIVRPHGEALVVLFRCNSPSPEPEEQGKGDLPRAQKCLFYPEEGDRLWQTSPIISWAIFMHGNWYRYLGGGPHRERYPELVDRLEGFHFSGTVSDEGWARASEDFHNLLDSLEE